MIMDRRTWRSCHAELGGLIPVDESEGSVDEPARACCVLYAGYTSTKSADTIQARSGSGRCEGADFVDV